MQVVGIIVPKALLTFAYCTASSNSSYHPQFPSWSLMPGPGPSQQFQRPYHQPGQETGLS